jgi:BACON domain-containing protein/all-beta uncharacterized protein
VRSILRSRWGLVSAALIAAATGCGGNDSPTEPTNCQFTVSPATLAFGSAGGSATASISTAAACRWTAASPAAWIALSPSGGTGPADVSISVAANGLETARSASVTLAGQTLSVKQDGLAPCSYDVSPAAQKFDAAGGPGTIQIAAASRCAWTPAANASWITIDDVSERHGDGTVSYRVAANSSQDSRAGIVVVAGQDVAIDQTGAPPPPPPPPTPVVCDYSVSPVEFQLHWHGAPGEGATVAITAPAGCVWTATPDAGWITLNTPANGAGSAAIRFAVSALTDDATRRAPLMIRWPTPTAGQNVWITQEGCRYAVGPSTQDVTVGGGRFMTTVFGDPISVSCAIGCPWTAQSRASWIRVTSSMPRAGDDGLFYEVDPNTTGQDRVGQIQIERVVLTVRQAGK